MEICTIGFTKRSAEDFFGALKSAGIRRLIDIRLRNTSQLAGFAKKEDLIYFLRELCDAEYVHEPLLAPTDQLLDDYKKGRLSWDGYERAFLSLMKEREIEKNLDRAIFEIPTTLLCSELSPAKCHRRLVLKHLQSHWEGLHITDL